MNTANIKEKIHYYYYFYRIAYSFLGILIWSYYNFLLLRTEVNLMDAVPILFQSFGIMYLGLYVGYILGTYLLSNLGYRGSYKISNLISLFAVILVLFNLNNIKEVYLAVALVKGVGEGLFWITSNNYMLREQHGLTRGRSISIIFSWQYLLEIIVPILGGSIISLLDYESLFIVGAACYFFVLLLPMHENSVPREKLSTREIKDFFTKRGFKRLTFVLYFTEIFSDQRNIIFAFLPFLLIGDELSAGLFLSGVGIVAVVISYFRRNAEGVRRMRLGYLGAWLVAVLTAFLAFVWTVPALFIRNSLAKLGFAVWSPVHLDLQNQVQELFLGSHLNESALEMTLYRETILLFARLTNLVLFLIIFYIIKLDIELALRGLVLLTIFREIFFLVGFENLRNMFKISPSNLVHAT